VDEYIEVTIDVFDITGQMAKIRKTLTIAGLIDEILREFEDLDRKNPEAYAIYRKGLNKPLDRSRSIAELDIQIHDELDFRYARGTNREKLPSNLKVFLVEDSTHQVFEIGWQPAIIGRPDSEQLHNDLLAANLGAIEGGNLISRRHAQITYENGLFFLENISANNPTYLNDGKEPINEPCVIKNGDKIYFGRMRVGTTFMVRELAANEVMEQARLIIQTSPEPANIGKVIEITRLPFTIGRESCDECITSDVRVSKKHALITYDPESHSFSITDLESSNGTFMNQVQIPANYPTRMSNDMVISLGPNTTMKFEIKGKEPETNEIDIR
jgi:pSer/pThr/pTyr-binding forkhead associated (FHA) protein